DRKGGDRRRWSRPKSSALPPSYETRPEGPESTWKPTRRAPLFAQEGAKARKDLGRSGIRPRRWCTRLAAAVGSAPLETPVGDRRRRSPFRSSCHRSYAPRCSGVKPVFTGSRWAEGPDGLPATQRSEALS